MIRISEAPIIQELDDHMATHVPFRSWCPFCISGKAVNNPHFRNGGGPGEVPKLSLGYAFMGTGHGEDDDSQHPLL